MNPVAKTPVRTVFLDRDGVVNRKIPEDEYVTRWEQFEVLPGVLEAVGLLNRAGIRVILVSNQRGIALRRFTISELNNLHARLADCLAAEGAHLDGIFYCPHDKDACDCRKPLPGMFLQAREAFPEIEAASSVMIGDSLVDIRFGLNLGMRSIFIDGDAAHQAPGAAEAAELAGETAPNLLAAVRSLLGS